MGSLVHYSMSEQLQCPCNRPGWQLISAGAAPAPDTQAASGEGQCSLKDLQSLTHRSEGQHRVPKIRLPPPNLGTSKNRLICVFLSPPAPPPHWHGSHPETPREVLCSQAHWSTPAAPRETQILLYPWFTPAGKEELLLLVLQEPDGC